RVWGFALWGKPTELDARRLVPLLALELAAPPHASLVDASRLDAGDPRAFAVLARYLRDNFATFRTCVTRLALVRPTGLLGATVAPPAPRSTPRSTARASGSRSGCWSRATHRSPRSRTTSAARHRSTSARYFVACVASRRRRGVRDADDPGMARELDRFLAR